MPTAPIVVEQNTKLPLQDKARAGGTSMSPATTTSWEICSSASRGGARIFIERLLVRSRACVAPA